MEPSNSSHSQEDAENLVFKPSVIQRIINSHDVQEQQDIDSNIITLHRFVLIDSIDNLQSKTLIRGYLRIKALCIPNSQIPHKIVD